jgi:hypothetical protein
MEIFTEDEMKLINSHLPTITGIIRNQSSSSVTITFRQDMKKLGEKMGLNICTTCTSGIFNLVTRIYNKYQQQLNERKNSDGRKKRNIREKN